MRKLLIPLLAAFALPTAVNADWGFFGCGDHNIRQFVTYYKTGYTFKDALDAVGFNDVKRCRAVWKEDLSFFYRIKTPSINVNWR